MDKVMQELKLTPEQVKIVAMVEEYIMAAYNEGYKAGYKAGQANGETK